MRTLDTDRRRDLEKAVLAGRRAAEAGARAALASLGVEARSKPSHLDENQAALRRGLRAKQRQLGGGLEVLVWECAYEQWHRLLFARFLLERGLLRHPEYGFVLELSDCDEIAPELGEPDGWSVAGRFAAEILPGIFRLDDPCVRLRLASEHRLALEEIVSGVPAEVFEADDSLGWVYQHWQSERKDEVNASEVKVGGADLGPVTQLFTENYMVRFLLENSLGAWWAARRPESPLVKEFEFLRFYEDGQPAAGSFDGWPGTAAEVTVMDPCCGSGHFLVEAFGMLWRMRAEEEGLGPVAAQDAVLDDNLFGLELDPRCVQIAMFAVALTAWKEGGGWRELPTPNVACSGIPVKAPLEDWVALADDDERLVQALERLHTLFKDADTLGSLIDPRRAAEMANAASLQTTVWDVDFDEVAPLLERAAARETDDPATAVLGADAAGTARAATLLSGSYDLITTNVPYLSRSGQGDVLREYCDRRHEAAKHDLATAFLDRFRRWTADGGAHAAVSPQNWLFLSRYETLRRDLLSTERVCVLVKIGEGGFRSGAAAGAFVGLSIVESSSPENGSFAGLDLTDRDEPDAMRQGLLHESLRKVSQESQLDHPDARIVIGTLGSVDFLSDVADSRYGLRTGDAARLIRGFWELADLGSSWIFHQSTPSDTKHFSGREGVLYWNGGSGPLFDLAKAGIASIQGEDAWGRSGVAVKLTRFLSVTLYEGTKFDNNCAVLWPKREADLLAVWSFCASEEFNRLVRELDSSLKVTNQTLLKVPFDLENWSDAAKRRYPNGLPEPWSDDPTQWLFEGHPEAATEPLQVGVGRLVGYRWPEQPESDDLDEFADGDGIVCLPAVGGELPTDDRLTALLSAAYGHDWSPRLVRRLLEEAGSKKKSLGDWLLGEFFKHHCKVFSNRPFVWHITDGRKDGFSALVNYHRLDRAGLEKLTYTYLGDWIERQRADAVEEVTGADVRLAAAEELEGKLEAILEGEPPLDIYVRWKGLHEQPIGWNPDLDDGVRLNIRPFVEAGVLAGPRSVPRVHWNKDRGKNPDGSERHNNLHYTRAEKLQAREEHQDG